jgi:hypothetical protein
LVEDISIDFRDRKPLFWLLKKENAHFKGVNFHHLRAKWQQ